MKYRKKPVVIAAVQWDGSADGARSVIDWILPSGGTARYSCLADCPGVEDSSHVLSIDTLEGTMTASGGDYIIRGVDGEFYPCKPHIFEQTYEPVVDDE